MPKKKKLSATQSFFLSRNKELKAKAEEALADLHMDVKVSLEQALENMEAMESIVIGYIEGLKDDIEKRNK